MTSLPCGGGRRLSTSYFHALKPSMKLFSVSEMLFTPSCNCCMLLSCLLHVSRRVQALEGWLTLEAARLCTDSHSYSPYRTGKVLLRHTFACASGSDYKLVWLEPVSVFAPVHMDFARRNLRYAVL